jgi:hypothetical protein
MTANLDQQIRYAQLLSESSLIPRHLRGNPANVLLFLALAEAQQVAPAVAFTGFQVIGDQPTMKPEMMRAQILRHGHSLKYEQWDKTTCTITGTRADNGDTTTVTWTVADAEAAGLKPNAGTWSRYRKAMLSARATGELARALFADCLNGISYTPEELGAEVDDEGAAVAAHAKAMDEQLMQPPPTWGKVEAVKPSAPVVDAWTAPEGETPPTPPEGRTTDAEWLDGALERAEKADAKALNELHHEASALHREGKLTRADLDLLGTAITTRKEAIARVAQSRVWPEVSVIPA